MKVMKYWRVAKENFVAGSRNWKTKTEKGGLQVQSQKHAEEASYAKELASDVAVKLKNFAK